MRIISLSFLLLLFLSGCAVGRTDFVKLNPDVQYPSKSATTPVFLTTMGLETPYQEVGFIHVSGSTRQGYEELNQKLRQKAREAGADGVIDVSYGTENAFSLVPFIISIPYDVLTAEGLAVKKKS